MGESELLVLLHHASLTTQDHRWGPTIHENTYQNPGPAHLHVLPRPRTSLRQCPRRQQQIKHARSLSNKTVYTAVPSPRRQHHAAKSDQSAEKSPILSAPLPPPLPPCLIMTIPLRSRRPVYLPTARIGIRHDHRCHRRELLLLGTLQSGLVVFGAGNLLRHRVCAFHVAPYTSLQRPP